MKWPHHRNLRRRPAKPALGRGRLQRQVRRAFTAADAPATLQAHARKEAAPADARPPCSPLRQEGYRERHDQQDGHASKREGDSTIKVGQSAQPLASAYGRSSLDHARV
jgi:hypothetical protein